MGRYLLFYGMFFLLFSLSVSPFASAQILPILGPPTNLVAQAVSTSQINLSWNPPSGISAITGYEIERSTNGGAWSTIVPTTGSVSTSYSDTGLSPGTLYSYRVSAITLLLVSSPSNTASATTMTPVTVPQPPTGLSAAGISTSQISLTWNAPSSNGGSAITGYEIERAVSGGAWSVVVSNTASTSTVYSDMGLSASTTYAYRVSAINSAGTSSPSNVASATTKTPVTVPQPPTGLSAAGVSTSQINLSWSAPSSNGGSAITGYKVERSADVGTTWSVIVSNTGSSSTAYSDTGLSSSTTYSYRVSAVNSVGSSAPSNTASAATKTPIAAPQPPANLAASAASSSEIDLIWSAPSSNGGSAITGYEIERAVSGGAWSVVVQNTASTSTAYSDTGLSENTAYSYRVSAINSAGTSSPSNVASATTPVRVHSITSLSSGLVVADPLTNETQSKSQLVADQKFWHYGGSATVVNAPYDVFKDSQGLHIGVQAPSNGSWAGYYAVAPSSSATTFHAVVSTPSSTVSSDFYENGLYVQTANGNVNYVTCFSDTSTYGTVWAIVSATGGTGGATQFNVLWYDTTPNQPLTRDCTIVTNGSNYLKVYLDGNMVYSNSTLNLQMPAPFIAFLEPQTSYNGSMLYGTYKDYYSMTDENIKIVNLPPNAARADVVDSTGAVIATTHVASGTATVDVGQYHMPLSAGIRVYDGSNNMIASSQGSFMMYGGNVYSYN